MNFFENLPLFANIFVRNEFRDRFLHEAQKKPIDLHRRICHDIETVFDGSYKNQNPKFQPSDQCLLLGWYSPMTLISWQEAQVKMQNGGGGYLVIKSNGAAFYAETEGYPAIKYSGSLSE